MSQRNSEYARKERDLYETPEWVTEAVIPHLDLNEDAAIWEPACGSGKMAGVLSRKGFNVVTSDLAEGNDFLFMLGTVIPVQAIITNPPYTHDVEFAVHANRLMSRVDGVVALLLRVDFDSAKTRAELFRDCPAWCRKVVLTKRIMWFHPEDGAKGKSPSENHAWYIWDWKHSGPPTIGYAP